MSQSIRTVGTRAAVVILAFLAVAIAAPGRAQAQSDDAASDRALLVERFSMDWAQADRTHLQWPWLRPVVDEDGAPSAGTLLGALLAVEAPVAERGGVWVAADDGGATLASLLPGDGTPGARLAPSAVAAVQAAAVADFAAAGYHLVPRDTSPFDFLVGYEGAALEVSGFDVRLAMMEDRPTYQALLDTLAGVRVTMPVTDDGVLVPWRPGADGATITVGDPASLEGLRLSVGGVQVVMEALRDAAVEADFQGTRVVPGEGQLQATADAVGRTVITDARDASAEGRLAIRLVVAVVTDLRVVARGEGPGDADRVIEYDEAVAGPARADLPRRYARMLRESPIRPYAAPGESGAGDDPGNGILLAGGLDDYLYRLSRHPGRRVDAAIAPGPRIDPGEGDDPYPYDGVSLDYLVTENDPLLLYSQVSNTGTRQTGTVRYRFGLIHNQLTDSDDILGIEYATPDFGDNAAVIGSYEARVGDSENLRWRVLAGWNEFEASEVGFANETFVGESWTASLELIWNFWQDRNEFLDLVGGVRYFDTEVENRIINLNGQVEFLVPYLGLRYEKFSDVENRYGTLTFEYSDGEWTDVNRTQLQNLGRTFPDDEWMKARFDYSHAFYLEPLLDPDGFSDTSTPETSRLAQELAFRVRGQYAFDDRLIPQEEQVAGGLYSVRGYPESVSASDNVVIGTLEYRLHVPRLFEPGRSEDFFGRQFRVRPSYVLGPVDWDLVFRGFVDAAYLEASDALGFEDDDTLIGAGVGAQLLLRNNLDVRVDWGFALRELAGRVNDGSNRVHVVATLVF